MRQLFTFQNGMLFFYNASRNTLEAATAWGALEIESDHQVFPPSYCWALRRGQVYWMDGSAPGLFCQHLLHQDIDQSVCVPLMAQGEILGVLHLRRRMNEPAPSSDADLDPAQIISLAKTVGEQIALAIANLKLREDLRNQSIRDPLTGLFNRRYLEETLGREIHRAIREQCPLSIIFMDIDRFKLFNDTFGHEMGDTVLRELGAFLNEQVRYEDIACRYGGEEFVVVLPDAPLEIAKHRAEEIRLGVKTLKVKSGGEMLHSITLSLGISAIPEFEANSGTLLRAADAALYQAKAEGRDRVVAAKP
jgi:diguanylate cyclase (GGDEF)-like protein